MRDQHNVKASKLGSGPTDQILMFGDVVEVGDNRYCLRGTTNGEICRIRIEFGRVARNQHEVRPLFGVATSYGVGDRGRCTDDENVACHG